MGLGLFLLRSMNWFQNLLIPAPMRIADLTFGGWSFAEVVRTAAALGVADALACGPMTAQALAKEIGALSSPPALAAHPTPLSLKSLLLAWQTCRGVAHNGPDAG